MVKLTKALFDAPRAEDVLRYPYLWARQAGHRVTEGRKNRPYAVILFLKAGRGSRELCWCAVAIQPPQTDTHAVEVTEIEDRRTGLDSCLPLWVVMGEHNVDVFKQSLYIEPHSHISDPIKASECAHQYQKLRP
ncbi:hypothetical protein [Roseobacter sp. HKCCA2468]|uniref:hypothetical protein n=1 Tax=Roseobacter sp. HKCCA2468 TaxID=3120342 RepID=UPI0030ECDB49